MADRLPPIPRARVALEDAEQGEIVVVPASVLASALRVSSARLDETVEPEDFAVLVEELIESVRHEERVIAKVFTPLPLGPATPAPATPGKTKWMTAEDRATIGEEYARVKGDGKMAPRGWKQEIAARMGYTESQITSAIGEARAPA